MTKKLVLFLSGITMFRLIYAIFLPIAPQEAYYWNYSRHPALSYFDHPPLAAYMIKLTTIFGVSGFSIHLAAIVISVIMSLAIYKLAELMFDKSTAFWSVVAINLAFIYALGGLIITPDNPMMLFWVLTMLACFQIARGGGYIWWALLGLFLGAGFMGKYTMGFAGIGAAVFFILHKDRLKLITSPGPVIAFVVAALVALPVFIWNYQHGWSSFLFQTERRAGEMTSFRPDFFFGFLGTIVGIYGIIPIPLLVAGIVSSVKSAFKEKALSHLVLISFSLPLVLFLLPIAARSWVKMNWTAPAFIGWFIAAVVFYRKYAQSRKWVDILGKISLGFLIISFIAVHTIALSDSIYLGKEDFSVGWPELAKKVDSISKDMPEPYVICGYEYKTASLLAFYLPGHPETISNNMVGRPGLEYDYWCDPDTLTGYNAIFVYDDRVKYKTPERLHDLFENISPDETLEIKKGGKKLTVFHIFRCYGYKGPNGG